MSKRKSPPKNGRDKMLSRRNLIISSIVGVTAILTFLIELPQKITASINIFKATEILQTDTPQPSATFTPAPIETYLPTATITLLPTDVILSPQSTPIILFSDDFAANVSGWVLGARSGDISRQNREITDGTLQLDIDFHDNGYGWATVPGFRGENFYIAVDAEVVQVSNGSKVGIVIAFRINNGGHEAYAIEFNNDGTFALFSTQTLGENGSWQLIHEERSDNFQIREGIWNKFAVRVLGQRFTAYVNDLELYRFEDNSIRNIGGAAIGVNGAIDKSAIVKFDNLTISK